MPKIRKRDKVTKVGPENENEGEREEKFVTKITKREKVPKVGPEDETN